MEVGVGLFVCFSTSPRVRLHVCACMCVRERERPEKCIIKLAHIHCNRNQPAIKQCNRNRTYFGSAIVNKKGKEAYELEREGHTHLLHH